MFRERATRMIRRDYPPSRSALGIFFKDLGIVQEAVSRHATLGALAALKSFKADLDGDSHQGDASLAEVYRGMAGLE